jgi:lysozyme
MKTSQRGIDLIKEFEGCELNAYTCSAGKLTIGYGHVIRPTDVIPNTITESEADELLAKDLERFEIAVLEAVDVPMAQNEFDALVAWSFNVGSHAMANSTLVKKLNGKEAKTRVADELLRWDKVNGKPLAGLTRRRKAERAMFLGDA